MAYIGSWNHFLFVFVCVCVSLSLYLSLYLSFCKSSSPSIPSQMISFQKIYGLDGLKHHTMEINGYVTLETDRQTEEQTESEK